ncbi:hypothetical protein LPJ64_001894 [Coemansia asiatica]|uniref:Uncharacterized protein n=1 Tax=Coemansia asiatica TaxID=1052880 RepID=A0A9W7XP48_9FUNG|nr:hypothetical protein LPJ64_001894 [Coemansia asiatica]
MYFASKSAFVVALANLALVSVAQQSAESEPKHEPEPFTLTFETTYRPQYTATATETARYYPIPLTPDLGQIANSLASQPSVAAIMRNAQYQVNTAANSRIEL